MHKSTKITPVIRKEVFIRWKTEKISQRQLAKEYHVDKRIIGRIIERGKKGDFDVHQSINKRFLKKARPNTKPSKKKLPYRSSSKRLTGKKRVLKKISPKKKTGKKK